MPGLRTAAACALCLVGLAAALSPIEAPALPELRGTQTAAADGARGRPLSLALDDTDPRRRPRGGALLAAVATAIAAERLEPPSESLRALARTSDGTPD